MRILADIEASDLKPQIDYFWQLSAQKIALIEKEYDPAKGSPVFTVRGKYTTRGWTEWTQGFQFGSAILQYDATGEQRFLDLGRSQTREHMAPHVAHFGVHDHGFNNVSTYGNLLRLMHEGRIEQDEWQRDFYELALKLSGAVQARRWTSLPDGGFIYSFNGPHSLFVDTIRSCRAVVIAHALGFAMLTENDKRISLLERAMLHAKATAAYSVFYGEGRDLFDVWGRTAHESIFNTNDGCFRCPNSQQGYSGFTTWTRGLAWAMLGFAEQLEFLDTLEDDEFEQFGGKSGLVEQFVRAARATCDFYIDNTPVDGIPYWDTGAPGLHKLRDYLERKSEPINEHEPIDSSAAAIGAQGLLRLGRYLNLAKPGSGDRYWQAGLTVANSLFEEPYLSISESHQGLILHSVYHRPNNWDFVPEASKIPHGESSMWGDYHAREVALYLQRMIEKKPYYAFFGCVV